MRSGIYLNNVYNPLIIIIDVWKNGKYIHRKNKNCKAMRIIVDRIIEIN